MAITPHKSAITNPATKFKCNLRLSGNSIMNTAENAVLAKQLHKFQFSSCHFCTFRFSCQIPDRRCRFMRVYGHFVFARLQILLGLVFQICSNSLLAAYSQFSQHSSSCKLWMNQKHCIIVIILQTLSFPKLHCLRCFKSNKPNVRVKRAWV